MLAKTSFLKTQIQTLRVNIALKKYLNFDASINAGVDTNTGALCVWCN